MDSDDYLTIIMSPPFMHSC